jgi:hypothetical protein
MKRIMGCLTLAASCFLVLACTKQTETEQKLSGTSAALTASPLGKRTKWEVGSSDGDYTKKAMLDDPVELKATGNTFRVEIGKNTAGTIKFDDLAKIPLHVSDTGKIAHQEVSCTGTDYVMCAAELLHSGFSYYVGFGDLVDDSGTTYHSLVAFIPIEKVAGSQNPVDHHFQLLIVHFGHVTDSELAAVQGGLIHGPGTDD